MTEKIKRRRGDRRDGIYLRNLDAMHIFMPLLYPNRCDNEAYISETIDLTAVDAYLEKLNAAEAERAEATGEPYFKYTLFHIIVAAILKTIYLRPKMNRFIANKKLYQRRDVTASFVVKKEFSDSSDEALAVVKALPRDTLEVVHEAIRAQVFACRGESKDGSTESMELIGKLPFWLVRFVVWLVRKLDIHGRVPASFIESDPYYTSVVLSNLGSIKLRSGYHHLTNWGTNSLFCIVGEMKIRPFFEPDGSYVMHNSVQLGLTVDERIADGYYYSQTVKLLKHLLANPELLELPFEQEIKL